MRYRSPRRRSSSRSEQRADQPARRLRVAHELRRLLVRRGCRQQLDAVLGGEVVELVRRAAGVDQVRGEQRVVARVDAERLRVVHDQVSFDAGRPWADHHVLSCGDRCPVAVCGIADDAAEVELALSPRHLDARHLQRRGRHRLVELVDAVEQVAELEPPEDLLQLGAVRRVEDELRRVAVDVEVATHRGELLREARQLGVLRDVPRTRGRQLARVLDHGLERAVLRDQLPCRLVADPGDARDVVARVALQADEVGNLLRGDAVARLDALGRVDVDVRDTARRHHQRDVLAAELERVAVGRDDARLQALGVRARGERRDHVVGLPALELQVPVSERLDDRPEVRELLPQQVRHRLAAFLVDDVRRLGCGRPMDRARVPGDGHALRPVVREQLEEHVREPEQRIRRLAVGRDELLGQREEGAIRQVVAVDDEEVAIARRRIAEVELGSGERFRHRWDGIVTRPCRSSRSTQFRRTSVSRPRPSWPIGTPVTGRPSRSCPRSPTSRRRSRRAKAPLRPAAATSSPT